MAVRESFPSCTILILSILLYSDCLLAASLVPTRYDSSNFKESRYNSPNPDMIKALEFIENLRQISEDTPIPDYDARGTFRPVQEHPFKKLQGGDRESPQWDTTREYVGEGKAEWPKLLLQALLQAESNGRINGKPSPGARRYHQEERAMGFLGDQQDYDGDEVPESDRIEQVSRRHHVAFPEDRYRVSPYKRTNEIVEEEYTPQSLATLESAFRELGKHAASHKERGRLEEEHIRKDEEEDVSQDRDFSYEDVADGEGWNSVEMKNRHQHKTTRFQDEEAEVDLDAERGGDRGKNAGTGFREAELDQLDSQEKAALEQGSEEEMPDAAADLMLQYYKGLQDRMEGGQWKRESGAMDGDRKVGNERMPNRHSRGSQGGIDPQVVNQLVELSGRLQIPPDDIVKMLRETEQRKQGEIQAGLRDWAAESSETGGEDKRFREPHTRGHKAAESAVEDLTPEDILSILGLDDRMQDKPAYFPMDQPGPHLSARLKGDRDRQLYGQGGGRAQGQDINIGDGELARYLEEILVKNPDFLNSAVYQDPGKVFLRGMNPRKAAEIMSVINNLAGNDYQPPRRQQNGEDTSPVVQKLMELINEQNEERGGPVKELNRGMFGGEV
ncbi:secretogranin-2 [Scyliorhinus canicula]|uniref:secretogranin-2 n=1 Tax=Scyliorhinus canicula TaxID=7830 RepID=UPI0018F32DA7|nr:secretogranin-2 [Scyliorhinus canicula]XP_038672305.1 secretogranin-2 [Scyliorhinus canicula]